MPLIDILTDVKIWVMMGIIFGLTFGFESPNVATILMVVLIAQMTVSLEGIKFSRKDFSTYRKKIIFGFLSSFGINTILTLLVGSLFIDNTALWYGWIMLASVPCAVSVVATSVLLKVDVKLSILSLTTIYVVALGLTPVLTRVLIGGAVNPLEILRYIVMFVAVPFVLSIPVGKLHLTRVPKVLFIDIMMLMLVFVSIGSRREYIFNEPKIILALALACVLRTFVVSIVLILLMKKFGGKRDHCVVYTVISVWKSSAMAVSITMAVIAPAYPEAVLPGVISLMIEFAWLAVMSGLINRLWPVKDNGKSTEVCTS